MVCVLLLHSFWVGQYRVLFSAAVMTYSVLGLCIVTPHMLDKIAALIYLTDRQGFIIDVHRKTMRATVINLLVSMRIHVCISV